MALSYHIAETLQVDLDEKQALLEEPAASRRLEAELDILRRDAEKMSQRLFVEMMSRFGRQ